MPTTMEEGPKPTTDMEGCHNTLSPRNAERHQG